MGYSIEGGTAAVAQALTQASDQLEAYRSEFTALVESLAAADWSGAPLDALESAQESLATAAEQITTAAELIGTGGAQVRDAYEAHSHVGTKESVMQA